MNDDQARLADALADCYRVEREPDAGGMATAWLAHDLRPDRNKAFRVLYLVLGAKAAT